MKEAKSWLAFALDVPTLEVAESVLPRVGNRVGVIKIGLELFIAEGTSAIAAVRRICPEADIFLDLKLHDIPETVYRAVKRVRTLGVRYLTVHADGGRKMLSRAAEAAGDDLHVLGVTVLTSTGAGELAETGVTDAWSENPSDLAVKRAELVKASGCSGVICSGAEVGRIKAVCGPEFLAVTPGIRPEWTLSGNDDQKRVVTPKMAITDGADLLVVGRPIRDAKDPGQAADLLVGEIRKALE